MRIRVRKLIPLLLLVSTVHPVLSQQQFLKGNLTDAQTQEPIAFATIRVKSKSVGVVSNEDGGFQIPEALKIFGDTLEISSMGYGSKNIAIHDLLPEKINRFELDPAVEVLQEVVVKGVRKRKDYSAEELIRKAISAIPKNYPYRPFSYVGYYRDYQWEQKNYINLNEAIIEVFDQGFGSIDYKTTKARIYEYRKNQDFPRDTVTEKPYDYRTKKKTIAEAVLNAYGGNEFTILRVHDAIRNHAINSYDFVNRLDIDFEKNHTFVAQPDTSIDNESLGVVFFYSYKGEVKVEGKIYISKRDFAIHRLNYSIYLWDKKRTEKSSGPQKGSKKLLFDIAVEYKSYEGLMYLNYISVNNIFKLRQPPKFTLTSFQLDLDKKQYELSFTQPPKPSDAHRLSRFKMRYKQNRIRFDDVHLEGNKVILIPSMSQGSPNVEIFMPPNIDIKSKNFDLRIKDMEDIYGNRLDQSETVAINQFREFFVQQVKPKHSAPIDSLFMNKNRPIFKDQPIEMPANFSEYWMNTPLQNVQR